MRRWLLAFAVFGSCVLVDGEPTSEGGIEYAPLSNGMIGCSYDETLCQDNEICFDDQLFGRCQPMDGPAAPDPYRYDLPPLTVTRLIREVQGLVDAGATWRDPVVQCSLLGFGLAFRFQWEWIRGGCALADDPAQMLADLQILELEMTSAAQNAINQDIQDQVGGIVALPPVAIDNDDSGAGEPPSGVMDVDKRSGELTPGLLEQLKLSDTLPDEPPDPRKRTDELTENDAREAQDEVIEEMIAQQLRQDRSDSSNSDMDDADPDELVIEPMYIDEEPRQEEADEDDGYNYLPDAMISKRSPVDAEATSDDFDDARVDALLSSPVDPGNHLPRFDDYGLDEDDLDLLADMISQIIENRFPKDLDLLPRERVEVYTSYLQALLKALRGHRKNGVSVGQAMPEVAQSAEVYPADTFLPSGGEYLTHKKDPETPGAVNQGTGDKPHRLVKGRKPSTTSTQMESPPRVTNVDDRRIHIRVNKGFAKSQKQELVTQLEQKLNLPGGTFRDIRLNGTDLSFSVFPIGATAGSLVDLPASRERRTLADAEGLPVAAYKRASGEPSESSLVQQPDKILVPTLVVCGVVVGVLVVLLGVYRIWAVGRSRENLSKLGADVEAIHDRDYEELCRQHALGGKGDKGEPPLARGIMGTLQHRLGSQSESPRSQLGSTSSWSEEPVQTNMDISTGHLILNYMEEHMSNSEKLHADWGNLEKYQPDRSDTSTGQGHGALNRYPTILPYDHTRVILNDLTNQHKSDYINASRITDHDPKNPAYLVTQGPLADTCGDFWQMVWEQGAVVLVNLTRLLDNGQPMCHRYWPDSGAEAYHNFEVNLVSEHIWCEDYLVRSLYLKNLATGETRTVTQFHFLTWPDHGLPSSSKAILEFRRKVNKSYRGRSSPIVVHCSDGSGRTGTYCLLDMALNRINKGVKEMDIAASLEHLRDQRMGMVETKAQFEFVLTCIGEEVQAILRALSQQ